MKGRGPQGVRGEDGRERGLKKEKGNDVRWLPFPVQ